MTPLPPSSPFPGSSRPGGSGPSSTAATQTPSGFIGRYQVLEKIGEGGMGSLYLARDPAIDRLVAIKLLRRGFDTEAVRERFAREARAAGRLRHPNIVTIFDVGEHDGDPFIAMEFLAGETLGELIRHGAGLSVSRRLKLLEELCDGLAYAHRAGLVHRDIKPANLMVDAEGVLKILDFGIVRVGESGMTAAGVLVGTINYMSPEQVLGTGVDHRSDIFAVGLVAYELLSGKQAFPGTIKDGLLKRIPEAEIEPLAHAAPGVDPEVVTIVEQALKKDAADRYQELARMRNDLARARQRIEVEEEAAAARAASGSAETALISQEATLPGSPMTPTPSSSMRHLADAERALAEGQYRVALTIAGRAAALDPRDRAPSLIVARAEAGLLDRGRTVEGVGPPTPRTGRTGTTPPPATPAANRTPVPASSRTNYLAVAVATLALAIAGFAFWSRREAVRDATDTTAAPPVSSAPQPSQPAPGSPPPAQDPPAPSTPQPSAAEPRVEAANPSSGTPGRASAPPPTAGRSGRREAATARGEPSAPSRGSSRGSGRTEPPPAQAERPAPKPEPPSIPTQPPGKPLSTLPGSEAPRPAPAPPPKPPETKAVETKLEQKPPPSPPPPPRDLRAEAIADIRQVLARYEAAWESLNFDALAAVHALSAAEARTVQRAMANARSYEVEMTGCSIEPAGDLRRATTTCIVTNRFLGQVSGTQVSSGKRVFNLEKRNDRWMIVSISGAR